MRFLRPLLIVLYMLGLVVMGAAADALNNTGIQTWGHVLEALEVAFCFFAVFMLDEDKTIRWREILFMFGTYICIRFAFFDYTYNLVAGNELTYLSENNFWGQLWLEVFKAEPQGIAWARLIFLIAGVSFPFKFL